MPLAKAKMPVAVPIPNAMESTANSEKAGLWKSTATVRRSSTLKNLIRSPRLGQVQGGRRIEE